MSGSVSKPDFDYLDILIAIQTNWGGDDTGTYRRWQNGPVSYSIPDSAPPADNDEKDGFQPLTGLVWGPVKAVVAQAFELWDEFLPGDFLFQVADTAADITFAYSGTTKNNGTYASPDLDLSIFDRIADFFGNQRDVVYLDHEHIWFSTNPNGWTPQLPASLLTAAGAVNYQQYGFQTMLHEIGHSLGLSHPGGYDAGNGVPLTYAANAEFAQDTRKTTIMSYFGGWDGNATAWTTDSSLATAYSATPTIYDIAAIQWKYGEDTTTRAGDTRYGWGSTAGWDFFDFAKNTQPVFAIWDAGGTDFLDASASGGGVAVTANQTISLVAGTYSSLLGMTDNVSIAWDTSIEGAAGGSGNDTITGNDADNLLQGNAGADSIIGGAGRDTLEGGLGNDRLEGGSGSDSLAGGSGQDTLLGGAGDDTLTAAGGLLDAASGNDSLASQYGDATLLGGDGNDTLFARAATLWLEGGAGNDIVTAGTYVASLVATLLGGAGDDTVTGGLGADFIEGGPGSDLMTGTKFADPAYAVGDTYIIRREAGADTITDFSTAIDRIVITGNPYVTSMRDLFGSGDPAPGTATTVNLDPLRFGQSLTLQGVSPTDLSPGNFVFDPPPPQGGDFFFASGAYIPFSPRPGDMAALTGGRTLIVNEMRGDTIGLGTASTEIFARLYGEDGALLKSILVNVGTAGQQVAPSVAALPGGGFVVAWLTGDPTQQYQPEALYDAAIRARIFDAAGNPLGGDITVNADLTTWNRLALQNLQGGLGEPEVWARPDGGFSVAWGAVRQSDGLGFLLRRDFGADGAALGAERIMGGGLATQDSGYYAALKSYAAHTQLESITLANGDGLLGWREAGGLRVLEIASDGSLSGSETLSASGNPSDLKLTQLSDGRVMASWFQDSGFYAKVLGAAVATQIAPASALATGYPNRPFYGPEHDAAALPGGAVAFFWTAQGGDIGGTSLQATILATDGTLSAAELVNPYSIGADRFIDAAPDPTPVDQGQPIAVTLSNGKVAVMWTDGRLAFPQVRALILDSDLHGAVVAGTAASESLTGSGWGDTITGFAGNDTLEGRAGPDRLDGGDGNDTASYEGSRDGVQVDLGFGTAFSGDAAGDTLLSIENLTGSGYDDVLAGSAGDNRLDGGWGNDTLLGVYDPDVPVGLRIQATPTTVGGRDTLLGGAGNDLIRLDGAFGEAHGGSGNDRVFGNAWYGYLYGEAGNDTLVSAGRSTAYGGDGADSLLGVGYDLLSGDAGNDTLAVDAGDYARLIGGAGDDSISASGSGIQDGAILDGRGHVLDGGTGNDTLAAGKIYNAILQGGDGADRLEAAEAGSTALDGGTGADTLVDRDGSFNLLRGGAGDDLIQLAGRTGYSFDYGGDGNDTILGTAGGEGISYFFGEAGNDSLVAGDGPGGRLDGGLGDDILLGGNGADGLTDGADGTDNDSLDGGAGDDFFISLGGRDTLDGGVGFDTAFVTRPGLLQAATILADDAGVIDATLPDGTLLRNLEQLFLSLGAGDDTVTLRTGDNVVQAGAGRDSLTGGAGRDSLDGGTGADTLVGGPGDDWYSVDDPGDLVLEQPGGGTDTVLLVSGPLFAADYRLPDEVENAILRGTGALRVLGNDLDNAITGNDDADTLEGGAGNDTLAGVGGDDLLRGGPGRDVAAFDEESGLARWSRDPATGRWIVTTAFEGNDTLDGIEALSFFDRTVLLPTGRVPFDLDGSGTADILWRRDDGALAAWSMAGLDGAGRSLGQVDPAWTVQGMGDFDGDGVADILWRHADGTLAQWWMGPGGGGGSFAQVGSDWSVAAIGDLDGDGHADILWRQDTGAVAAWLMNGLDGAGGGIADVPTEWAVRAIADFNGDGRGDILWQNTWDGEVAIWLMDGLQGLAGAGLGPDNPDWVVVGAGDVNGDGYADIVWQNAANGDVRIAEMRGLDQIDGGVVATPGLDWRLLRVADYDGDGRSDLLWRNLDGTVAIWLMDGLVGRAGGSIGAPGLEWTVA